MVQAGEDLPLSAETTDDVVGVLATLDEFNGHFLLKGLVGACAQVDGSHATLAELSNDLIRTDILASKRAFIIFFEQIEAFDESGRFGEASFLVGGKKRLDFLAEGSVPGAGAIEKGSAACRFTIQGRLKQILNLAPAIRFHNPT